MVSLLIVILRIVSLLGVGDLRWLKLRMASVNSSSLMDTHSRQNKYYFFILFIQLYATLNRIIILNDISESFDML